MLIQRGQQIAGMEAVDARSLMRSMNSCALSPGRIAEVMGTSKQAAVDRLAELAAVGLVEVSADVRSRWRAEEEDDAVEYWAATLKGRALAKARLGRPVSRSKAEAVFRAFLGRVEDANSDPDELFWVESVELFGSFADPGRHAVGDVDLRVVLSQRDAGDTHMRRVAEAVAGAQAAGRNFRSYFDEVYWPQRRLEQRLRMRNSLLDIQFDSEGHLRDLPAGSTVVEVYRRVDPG